jgi:uncharacterized repeat protein (TIGR03943 family)
MTDLAKWRTLFLLGSALAIGAMWSQGALETFLHPRYAALLPWAMLVLLAMGLVELRSWSGGHPGQSVKFRHVFWFLPFAMGMALRPEGFSGEFAASRGLTAAGRMLAEAGGGVSDADFLAEEDRADDAEMAWIDSVPPELGHVIAMDTTAGTRSPAHPVRPAPPPGPVLEPLGPLKEPAGASIWCELPAPSQTACVDSLRERFWYEQMLALYMEPSRHRGRRVRLVGMVQRDGAVEPDGWHVGRMMVWCCAADAAPLGLYLIGAVAGDPPAQGAWVAIEGLLDIRRARLPGMARVRDVPVLREATVTNTQPPQQENVFPFSY